jgi:phosphatidylglycerophosphate synthase
MKPFFAKYIPWSLVALRFCLGPAMMAVAFWVARPQPWLGLMLVSGFLSDVYDGVLARRWKTETPRLRVADSAVDIVFYLCGAASLGLRHWDQIRLRLWLLAAVVGMEALRMAFDFWKYGRMSSYHSYLAKSWGAALVVATVSALCFDRAYGLLTVAMIWGVACDLEGLAMSLMLPPLGLQRKNATCGAAFACRTTGTNTALTGRT